MHSRARIHEMKQNVVTEQTERVRALETRLQEQLALLSEGDSSALAAAVAKQRLLQLEVDRLTRDLQAARNERERQRSHVEEGKAIAVSLQEELTKLKLSKESELKILRDQMTALEVEKTALAKQAALHEDDVKDFMQKQEEHKKVVEDMQKRLEESTKREETLQQQMEEKQKLFSSLPSKCSSGTRRSWRRRSRRRSRSLRRRAPTRRRWSRSRRRWKRRRRTVRSSWTLVR